ncbi:MAG: AAA family ATPase [Planctomycetaceae bacterium]|jgi:hypothetical protein
MDYTTTNGTKPPGNLPYERGIADDLLAEAMHDPGIVLEAGADLPPQVFLDPEQRTIWQAIRETFEKAGTISPLLVAETLERKHHLRAAGGVENLTRLAEAKGYAVHYRRHIEILREHYERRRLIETHTRRAACAADLSVAWADVVEYSHIPDTTSTSDDFSPVTSDALDSMELNVEWLIDDLLPAARPGILAGPSKGCKTTLAVSAAVAVAAGVPWCGRSTAQGNVLVVSCESGRGAIQATARRVCRANGLKLGDLKDRLAWQFDPLDLTSPRTIRDITKHIERHKARLVILDPAYILLAGLADQVNNQMAMGAALQPLGKMAADTGAAILLCAHYIKSVATAQTHALPELSSIAHAGLAQWMRFWWLVNRREAYDPENLGQHALWLVCGGSDGQATSWGVDLQEGHDGSGWRLDVQPASAAMAQREESREEEKIERQETKRETRRQVTEERNDRRVLSFLTTHARTWLNVSKVRNGAGQSNGTTTAALDRLVDAGTVVCRENERSGKPEFLLKSSLDEVTRAEAEAKAATQRDNHGTGQKPPYTPDGCPVPSGDGHDDRQDERDSPDSPVCPVSPEKRRPKQKTTRARKGKTAVQTTVIVEATSVSATSAAGGIEIIDDGRLETGDTSTTTQVGGTDEAA